MTDPSDTRPDVSVVVVNFRSAALTLRALEDCAAAALGLTLQEIVVDGASDGDEVAVLRAGRPGAEVIELDANRGFAAGNNAGFVRATGRYLLLVNPDAFAHTGAVARLVAHLEAEPGCGVAAPGLVFEDGAPQDNAHKRFPNLLTLFVDCCAPVAVLVRGTRLDPHNVQRGLVSGAPRPVAHVIGAALLVRAEAAEAAGPMDDGYFLYLEETEWQRRITAAGWRIDVVPEAVFTHLGGGSTGSIPLAGPHFLDSVERYYPQPRLALVTMGAGAIVSLGALLPARALGRGGEKVRVHADAMLGLVGEVARRLSGRRRSAARPS